MIKIIETPLSFWRTPFYDLPLSKLFPSGVPAFEYSPATEYQPLLFELFRPLDDLENMLLNDFAGQTIKMIDIYEQHHVDKRYIKKNYKDTLLKLEAEGKIITNPF